MACEGTELYKHRFGYDRKKHIPCKNYRTTTQIAEAAYSLIREDSDIVNDDNFVKPSLIDKQGIYPVFARYNTIGEEILGVENLKKLLKRYEAKEIAIVARTKRILEEVKKKQMRI